MRPGDDGGGGGIEFAAQCGAEGISGGVYAVEVEAASLDFRHTLAQENARIFPSFRCGYPLCLFDSQGMLRLFEKEQRPLTGGLNLYLEPHAKGFGVDRERVGKPSP